MDKGFDIAATNYDNTFTHSSIGKHQRYLVYLYLNDTLDKDTQNILEINCGTGEDAIWLSSKGHKVLATDLSKKMIEVAKQKALNKRGLELSFSTLDIKTINKGTFNRKFDMVFSNFGGLNCLNKNELSIFFNTISKHLSPNGKLSMVIMSKNCLWEQLYFILKGKWKTAFRRKKSEAAMANVDGVTIPTWYFNPKDIKRLTSDVFKVNTVKPVGFFIPPSYLEPFFKNKLSILKVLYQLEKKIKKIAWLSKYSDHYIIELQLE